jgi:hypothetical protein
LIATNGYGALRRFGMNALDFCRDLLRANDDASDVDGAVVFHRDRELPLRVGNRVTFADGSFTGTPLTSAGTTTMKMINRTRQTSTSGVTLMFDSSAVCERMCMAILQRGPTRVSVQTKPIQTRFASMTPNIPPVGITRWTS